jgi:hypothetical protein
LVFFESKLWIFLRYGKVFIFFHLGF